MPFLLMETERNIPVTEVTRWDIMDAMMDVAVEWVSITSTVIQTYLSKCGFVIEDVVDIVEEDQDTSDWAELQGKMNCLTVLKSNPNN